jgi:aminoglycoside phosphotransferase (APT) family kinase protein
MPPTYEELQSAPPDDRLQAIASALGRGLKVESVTRLRGGIDNGMHVLELGGSRGRARRVVLRRYRGTESTVARAQKEFRLLKLVESFGIPVPQPLLLDDTGETAGTPAIVTSFIDGKPAMVPAEAPEWSRQVAEAIWKVHSADIGGADTQFFEPPVMMSEAVQRQITSTERFEGHPLGRALCEAMAEAAEHVEKVRPALIHGDYWAGNTLWNGGRLIAIVDWDDGKLGDPAMDVGYMWMDLMILGEREAADRFVEEYEQRSGGRVANLRLGALLGLSRAMPDPTRWFASWEGSGRMDITPESVMRNFDETIRECLG